MLGNAEEEVIDTKDDNNNNGKDNDQDLEKVVVYDMSDTLEFTYNNIKFSGFKVSSNYLVFSVENTTDELLDLSTNKYYIETYSTDNTLLERHIFNSYKINPTATLTQSIALRDSEIDKVSKIAIINRTQKDYPDVTLQVNSENEYPLTCSNNTESIVYTYDKDNKLLRIKDIVKFDNDGTTSYSNNLIIYQSKAASYNNKEGVSSSLVEISTGFNVTTEIDLTKANTKDLNNDYYYDKSNAPKVVKYEMESRGFSCK